MLYEAKPVTASTFEQRVIKMFGVENLVKAKTTEDRRTVPGAPRIPITLYYVKNGDGHQHHVATWNGETKRGWVFDSAKPFLKK
jgi:uncharacterized membrane-anchored protein